jgi:hypothetical protein
MRDKRRRRTNTPTPTPHKTIQSISLRSVVCVLFFISLSVFQLMVLFPPPLGPVTFDRRDTVRATGPVGTGGATGPAAPHHQRVRHSPSDSNKLTAGTPTFHKAQRHASTKSRIDSDKLHPQPRSAKELWQR